MYSVTSKGGQAYQIIQICDKNLLMNKYQRELKEAAVAELRKDSVFFLFSFFFYLNFFCTV